MTTPAISSSAQTDRSLGVWVLTLYAALFLGLQTALGELLAVFSGDTILNSSTLLTLLTILAIPLGIGILITAIGTWQGKPAFRNVLVVLVVLLSLLQSATALLYFWQRMAIFSHLSNFTASAQVSMGTVIVRSLLVAAIFVVYFLRQREFFRDRQDAPAGSFFASLAALPEGRSYFLLAGSLVVFLHWMLIFAFSALPGLNIFLAMPAPLIDSALTAILYPQPFEVFVSTIPLAILQSVIAPMLSAAFWFALGVGLAYKIKPLKRMLAVAIGIKIILLWLGLMMALNK